MAVVCTLLSCGLTAFAAEEGSIEKAAIEPTTTATATAEPTAPPPEEIKPKLYPTDVKIVGDDNGRQIVKTYALTADNNPDDIPRESFERDGWRYAISDITQKKSSGTDTRPHKEIIEINTDKNDLNVIISQLLPTIEYESEDGYSGLISLDLATVKCEPAGYKNSSYTVSATREYPHLSSNDTSLIPKSITENGRTLELDGVTWDAQNTVNVDYQAIPDGYNAVAKYTAKVSKSVVTGYCICKLKNRPML